MSSVYQSCVQRRKNESLQIQLPRFEFSESVVSTTITWTFIYALGFTLQCRKSLVIRFKSSTEELVGQKPSLKLIISTRFLS